MKFQIKYNKESLKNIRKTKKWGPVVGLGGARLDYYFNDKLMITDDFYVSLTLSGIIKQLVDFPRKDNLDYCHEDGRYWIKIHDWQSEKISVELIDTSIEEKETVRLTLSKKEFLASIISLLEETIQNLNCIKDEYKSTYKVYFRESISKIKSIYNLK